MAWEDYATATALRDLFRRIAMSEIDRSRPTPRYATVETVNLTGKSATVTYSGESVSVPVSFASEIPSVGAKVRIEGPPGARYIAGVYDIPWVAPTLTSPWVNYGSGYAAAGYMRDQGGFVHIRGLLKAGSAGNVFVLPAGYRPLEREIFPITAHNGGSLIHGYMEINNSTGQAYLSGAATWTSVSGISFRAEV